VRERRREKKWRCRACVPFVFKLIVPYNSFYMQLKIERTFSTAYNMVKVKAG